MASFSVCYAKSTKSHFRPTSFSLFSKPSATLKPVKITLLSTKIRAFSGMRLVTSRVRYGGVVACAGTDFHPVVPGFNRLGGVVESDKLPSDVRKRAMDAVDACGGRVTIGDVGSVSGFKLDEVQKALQALASDTNGFLEVSDEGDVLYVFPKDYRSKLASKSFRMKIDPLVVKGKSTAECVIKVSFGTLLIASIVLVFATIIVLLLGASSKSGKDKRSRGGRSYSSGSSFDLSHIDNFRLGGMVIKSTGTKFIELIFSFVFGDRDPNEEIEAKRWKLIGQYITANGGVVIAEELAPFLDVEISDRTMNDESYILPVLLRFDGQPEVDEEGNILYRFPSLQRTASSSKGETKEFVGEIGHQWVGGADRLLEEKKLEFSKTSLSEKALAIGLGGLNLCGVIVLGSMLRKLCVEPSGFVSFVSGIFHLLKIYAVSFFAIPLARWFVIRKTNASIEKRNQARAKYSRLLEMPDTNLRRKLHNARDMARRTVISKEQIVYSTERDVHEQEYGTQEWDKKLQEIDKSDTPIEV